MVAQIDPPSVFYPVRVASVKGNARRVISFQRQGRKKAGPNRRLDGEVCRLTMNKLLMGLAKGTDRILTCPVQNGSGALQAVRKLQKKKDGSSCLGKTRNPKR
jgi:hypothetical protein